MTAFALKRDELLTPDNFLLAALGCVALLFGYLSFKPPSLSVREGGGEKIALISDVDSTVKRKPAGALAWDEADAPDELFTGDQIFTDKASQARVRFDDGSEISIAENSLVKIEKQGGKTTLDMSKGFVSGKFGGTGGKSDFTIKMGTTQVKLDQGAELQVKIDPNDKNATRIALVSGDADVQSAGGEKLALGKNQVLSVDTKTGAASVQDVSVTLVLPKAGEELDAGDNPSVFFKWEAKGKDLVYTVVVARDSQFKDVIQRRETSSKALTVQAPASGLYYWKVQSLDKSNGRKDESIESSFTVSRLDAPELLAPVSGKSFPMESAKNPVVVSFLWRSAGPAKAFEVEIAKDKTFLTKVVTRKLADTSFETKELDQGVYYWRVRAHGADASKAGPYSPVQEFRVDRLAVAKPPRLLEPDGGKHFAPSDAITFRWSAEPGVDAFQFDISRTKTFSSGDGTVTKQVNGTALTLVPENPGTHYWRVKAVDPFGRDTAYSEVRPLGLDAATPQLITPDDGAKVTLAQKDLKIDFAWLKSQGAKGYLIEVARDPGFQDQVLKQKVTGTQFGWNKLKPGTFYWRVRPEIPGVKDAAASPGRLLELKGLELLPGPSLKDRYYFRLPPPSGPGTAMLRTLMRLLSSGTAKAQEASSEVDPVDSDKVTIHWKPIAGAESYYVEVAADPDFAQTTLKHKTKTPTFVWPEATPGRYFLRAASVDAFEQTGKFSRISELIVNYRAPKLYEPRDHATLKPESGKAAVDFTWQNVGGDPKLWLEISPSADFAKPAVSKPVKGGTTKVTGLGEGSYYWRIRARYRSTLPVEAAKPFRFKVAGVKLKAPTVTAPKQDAVLFTDQTTLPALVQWSEVKGAESYELLVARDDAFSDLAASKSASEAGLAVDLAPGSYYAKVHAVAADGAKGPDSAPRPFEVKGRLSAPAWELPQSGQEFVMTGKDAPQVDLAFKAVPGAASYVLELSTTDQFKKLAKKLTLNDLKTTVTLSKGRYFARVHALNENAEPGKTSDTLPFSVVRKDIDAPDLIYPEDGDLLSRSKSVRLNWTKENAFTGYRVVMSRDPKFQRVVYDKTVDKDSQAVPVPKSGKYYWYVEGKDKQKKYAMRSDVQTFKVSDYAPSGGDKIRLMGAYAPSVISNTMVGDSINNSLSVAAFNSFVFTGQYWLTRPFGLEASYQRKSAELYSNDDDLQGSGDQRPLEFIPQSFDLRTKFRLLLGTSAVAPELHARAGYMYKTFYTYFATSRTALDLQETKTHSLSLGLGGKLPLALDQYLEGAVDLAKPVASSPSKVTGGQHLMVDTGYYMLFPSRLTAGLGYRFANATYAFVDDSHDVSGVLEEKSYSVLGSLGYGF